MRLFRVQEVPGSNPGGPIIFRRKIEGGQSHSAGGERRLGRGKVGRGPISRRPDELKRLKLVLADRVREEGDLHDFLDRYGRAVNS